LTAIQAQIQTLLAEEEEEEEGVTEESNTRSNVEVAKPLVFSRETEKVGGFITACRLYLRMKMKGVIVEEQIQ